ncbi:Serine/threonine protein kinase [Hyella patelloides LEGE 07179]|uniref:Serine/threonine protein kinase n=1 Tax=Hyella patelloides LEGE 07179 TaxID=945734 RepID=A0A563VMY6_9CYAN|nr:serine/threonine-protein kinase [Hyella patelloides]VEP12772.1 Serine/threonine protein kinase [Hyella patelloides LEGE 07179]
MIWKPNETIQGGKYLIEEVLGVGGFGVTYRAKDVSLNKFVAIKTANDLIQTQKNFSQQQDKFVQEAFRLAKCRHAHIVEVKDVCREGELWCMVMEYITGGNLEQYTIKKQVLSAEEALLHIRQVGAALTYIHQQGLIHRDVKPSNIMLRTDTAEAVLIDFGLAREFVDGKIQTHTNARTESYAPIEQYQIRAKRGAYTDVYALAATFYFLLTGIQPLPAQFRWQGAKLIPPKKHNPHLSDLLNQGIIQGMILEPEERPQSVQEWLEIISVTELQQSDQKYSRLTELLAVRQWERADEETYDLILKMSRRVKEGWLDYPATQNLSCEVLQIIDRLWLNYSDGRFGFSVQRKIWQELGGKIDYSTECLLGERLGWRVENNWLAHDSLNFSLDAVLGHFPWNGHLPQGKLKELGLVGSYSRWWSCLILSRCQECNI